MHSSNKEKSTELKLKKRSLLQSHGTDLSQLKTLEKDIEDITFYSCTQAVADRTGYRGFADWAEKTSRTHEHLLVTLGQVAFVGASLMYGAIFGSSRGNIGLMCYAFALFDCGFIVPTVALALLKWASQQPKDAVFASPQVWTLLLNIFLYGSAAAIGVAICLLNISLVMLHFSVDQNGQLDAKLQFNVEPTPAGTLALGCLGLAAVVVVVSGLSHYLVNSWDAMIKDFFGCRECCREGLQDYVLHESCVIADASSRVIIHVLPVISSRQEFPGVLAIDDAGITMDQLLTKAPPSSALELALEGLDDGEEGGCDDIIMLSGKSDVED
ncbi:hypothetical protein BDR07DRAFT_1373844 [Suillus spraguei]|nr:hypothetical protein BDR07DRAFT_1373844 [Suillus spraguei]